MLALSGRPVDIPVAFRTHTVAPIERCRSQGPRSQLMNPPFSSMKRAPPLCAGPPLHVVASLGPLIQQTPSQRNSRTGMRLVSMSAGGAQQETVTSEVNAKSEVQLYPVLGGHISPPDDNSSCTLKPNPCIEISSSLRLSSIYQHLAAFANLANLSNL